MSRLAAAFGEHNEDVKPIIQPGSSDSAALDGVCEALGWRYRDQADIAAAWQRIRGRVRDWTDLEPELIGRVEELIDFVTAPV